MITIGTGWSHKTYRQIGTYTAEINEAYAKENGYSFVSFSPYKSVWSPRVPQMTEYQRHMEKVALCLKHLPDCKWMVWIDADACFIANGIEEYLDDQYYLILQSGEKQSRFVNTGLFFLRNCQQSFDLLDEMNDVSLPELAKWQQRHRKRWKDQSAYYVALSKKPNLQTGIKKHKYGKLWSRPEHLNHFSPVAIHANRRKRSRTLPRRLRTLREAIERTDQSSASEIE